MEGLVRKLVVVAVCLTLAAALAACGGDDDAGSPSDGSASATRGTSAATTPAAASGTTMATVSGTPVANTTSSSASGGGAGGPATAAANDDATAVSGSADGVSGGGTDVPRQAVGTLPPPPPGKTPAIDPTTIADPGDDAAPSGGGGGSSGGPAPNALQLALDLDAATPGIQSTRTVAVGDVIRVAVVVLNIPAGPGLSAFNFEVDYDRTKVVAPTFAGGEADDRNPDLNDAAVGDGWTCLPAPQGDLDDPGGIDGDGDPATGQAFLSCFAASGNTTGSAVVATIEMHAIAAGTAALSLARVNVAVGDGIEIARCADSDQFVVPCAGATLTVQ